MSREDLATKMGCQKYVAQKRANGALGRLRLLRVQRLGQPSQFLTERRLGHPDQALQQRGDDLVPLGAGQPLAATLPSGRGAEMVLLLVQLAEFDQLPKPLPAALQAVLFLVAFAGLN